MKKVTKQKFYEAVILWTYRLSEDPKIIEETEKLEKSGFDFETGSFSEFLVHRAILGLDDLFPEKQPFDKLGFEYFAQATGFVLNSGVKSLVDMYFSVLDGYPGMVDFSDAGQAGFMFDVFLDMTPKDKAVAERLGSFLFRHAENCEWFPGFLSVAYALSMFDLSVSLDEILEMRRKHPFDPETAKSGENEAEDPA